MHALPHSQHGMHMLFHSAAQVLGLGPAAGILLTHPPIDRLHYHPPAPFPAMRDTPVEQLLILEHVLIPAARSAVGRR